MRTGVNIADTMIGMQDGEHKVLAWSLWLQDTSARKKGQKDYLLNELGTDYSTLKDALENGFSRVSQWTTVIKPGQLENTAMEQFRGISVRNTDLSAILRLTGANLFGLTLSLFNNNAPISTPYFDTPSQNLTPGLIEACTLEGVLLDAMFGMYAVLDGVRATETSMQDSVLDHARFDRVIFRDCSLARTSLMYAEIKNSQFFNTSFKYVAYKGAYGALVGSTFDNCDFTYASLEGFRVHQCTFKSCSFVNAIIKEQSFNLLSSVFDSCSFVGATIYLSDEGDERYSIFNKCDFRSTTVENPNPQDGDTAILPNLLGCDASGAWFGGTSFRGQCSGTSFRNAHFGAGVNFAGADVSGSDFTGSDIDTYIEINEFKASVASYIGTIWADGSPL